MSENQPLAPRWDWCANEQPEAGGGGGGGGATPAGGWPRLRRTPSKARDLAWARLRRLTAPAMILSALIAMVLLSPLPFGSVPQWAWSAMAGATGALLLGWGWLAITARVTLVRPPLRLSWAVVPFALALAWAAFQTVPSSPASLHHPLWRSTAEVLGTTYHGSISLDPAAGWASIVRIVTCAGIFWLALQFGRDAEQARRMFAAVALGAAGYGLYGLLVQFSGVNTILWFDKTAYHDVVTATFVNRNSFATFAGLGLLCAVAVLRESIRRILDATPDAKERFRRLLDGHPIRDGLLLAAALVSGTAILLSESRAGTAASGLALAVFFVLLAARRRAPVRTAAITVGACALAGAALLAFSGEGVERRLWSAESDWEGRAAIAERTRAAIREAPVLGTGLGTFASVYRLYRPAGNEPRVERAHNDYLEMALELGVPAAASFVAALGAIALACGAGAFVRRRHAGLSAVGFAAGVLVGAHALVDFSLQVPAVAATFALVLGAASAQSWRTVRGTRSDRGTQKVRGVSTPSPASARSGSNSRR